MLKAFPVVTVILLSACSSYNSGKLDSKNINEREATPAQKYAAGRSQLVPVNAIASSNNKCVDNFNFLRQSSSDRYQKYSQDYIKIGNGYTFLNTNKNIMGSDAKEVYTMKLDMKLDSLCNKVDYAGYQVIKDKMQSLQGI